MNNIVKYNNCLNALDFKGFSSVDYDFLMYLCAQLRDQGDMTKVFSLDEIRRVTGYNHHDSDEEFIKKLTDMNKKLMNVITEIEIDSKRIMFVLFPTFVINKKEKTLTVCVNKDFGFILNELTKNFTQFELKVFTRLTSKYSKTLYRLLRQYRNTGKYYVKVEELRRLLGCPNTYPNGTIVDRIINPSVKELADKFDNLQCICIKSNQQGRKLIGFEFSFTPSKNQKKITKNKEYSAEEIREKEIEREREKQEKRREEEQEERRKFYWEEELEELERKEKEKEQKERHKIEEREEKKAKRRENVTKVNTKKVDIENDDYMSDDRVDDYFYFGDQKECYIPFA